MERSAILEPSRTLSAVRKRGSACTDLCQQSVAFSILSEIVMICRTVQQPSLRFSSKGCPLSNIYLGYTAKAAVFAT